MLRQPSTKLTPMSSGGMTAVEKKAARTAVVSTCSEISGDYRGPGRNGREKEPRAARLRRGDEIAQVSRALKDPQVPSGCAGGRPPRGPSGQDLRDRLCAFLRPASGSGPAQYVERFKQEISGRPEEQAREPAPIHQDDSRRLPQGWRLIAGMVVLLLGVGVWHLLSPGDDANQPLPPAPVLNPPKVAVAPPPTADHRAGTKRHAIAGRRQRASRRSVGADRYRDTAAGRWPHHTRAGGTPSDAKAWGVTGAARPNCGACRPPRTRRPHPRRSHLRSAECQSAGRSARPCRHPPDGAR